MSTKNIILAALALLGIAAIFDLKRIGHRFYLSDDANARLNLENAVKRGRIDAAAAAAYVEALNTKRVNPREVTDGLIGLDKV